MALNYQFVFFCNYDKCLNVKEVGEIVDTVKLKIMEDGLKKEISDLKELVLQQTEKVDDLDKSFPKPLRCSFCAYAAVNCCPRCRKNLCSFMKLLFYTNKYLILNKKLITLINVIHVTEIYVVY
jgi:hypothetical protein